MTKRTRSRPPPAATVSTPPPSSEPPPAKLRDEEPKRAGMNWGNIAAGFTAACALAVSAYTAYLQRQQVKAQVWPVLSMNAKSSVTDDGRAFAYLLKNNGVGPAVIHAVEVFVDGKPMRNWYDVLVAISPPVPAGQKIGWSRSISSMHGRILGAGEEIEAFAPHGNDIVHRFDDAAERTSVSICYCSVLDDCWILSDTGDEAHEPRAVRACVKPAVPFQD